MQISKRHHYTPRYYLKRFENDEGAVWRFDIDTQQIVRGNNERFGFKKYWNTMRNPPSGYDVDWAEKQIAQIDGFASGVIRELVSGRFPKDIRPLAVALSLMVHNQPRLMKEMQTKHPHQVNHWSEDHWLIVMLRASLENWKSYVPLFYVIYAIEEGSKQRFMTSGNPLIDFEKKKPCCFLCPASTAFSCRTIQHTMESRRSILCVRQTWFPESVK